MKKKENNCYTYFAIRGNFEPEVISDILKLKPVKSWHIGDIRRDGKSKYEFAHWEYGRCETYDVCTENQMMQTIAGLKDKTDLLNRIKNKYDVSFILEIVPEIYAKNPTPCLAPNQEIIEFCFKTGTMIDIDLYII